MLFKTPKGKSKQKNCLKLANIENTFIVEFGS